MNDTLERDLRRHFDDRTAHLPDAGPGLPAVSEMRFAASTDDHRRHPMILAAAAALIAVAAGSLLLLAGRGDNSSAPTADGGTVAPGELQPAATLPNSPDVSDVPVTVLASEPADWYRLAPDLDVSWYEDGSGTSPSMFCWRTPANADGVCFEDMVGSMVVPLVVPSAGGQTLVLARGDRSNPEIEVTLDDGSRLRIHQDVDHTIDWGVSRLELPSRRHITLVGKDEPVERASQSTTTPQ